MEKIYKKICLERSRSRSQGLVPFIKLGDSGRTNVNDDTPDGNWGGFPYNPKELVEQDKTYMDVMYRYFEIWKQIRNGIIVKKLDIAEECDCAPVGLSWTDKFVDKKNPVYLNVYDDRILAVNKEHFYFNDDTETYFLVDGEYTDANDSEYLILVDDVEWMNQCASYLDRDWKEYCEFVDENYLGKVVIPEEKVMLGERVPRIMFYADIPQYIKWMRDTETSNDCCTKEIWKARGGSEFTAYLESILSECESAFSNAEGLVEDESASTPTIDIMVSLTQNVADEGAFKNYDETWYEDYENKVGCEPYDYHDGIWDVSGDIRDHTLKIDCGVGDNRESVSWPYPMSTERKVYTEEEQFEVPSYLPELIHTPYFYDDNRMIVNGKMVKFNDEPNKTGFFKCTYYESESNPPAKHVTISGTYDDNGQTRSFSSGWCETEEVTPWPKSDAYQVIHPKVTESSTRPVEDGTNYIPETWNGHTILTSSQIVVETYRHYAWWEAVEETLDETYEVADGVGTLDCKNQQKYRMLTMLEAIECLVPSDYNLDDIDSDALSPNDTYYFLVIYDNGPIDPVAETGCSLNVDSVKCESYMSTEVPFDLGIPYNLTTIENTDTYMGDAVLSTGVSEGLITIRYVIGGIFDSEKRYQEGTGTILEETHNYYPDKMFYHNIDGVSGVPVYCNYIDFESDKKTGVSSYNGLTGRYNTSIVKEMDTGDVWASESGSIRSVIYKEDYLLGVSYEPETDINVSYDNGTVAAWEKHFKLGECNTFSDLSNYGNNYFNLQ